MNRRKEYYGFRNGIRKRTAERIIEDSAARRDKREKQRKKDEIDKWLRDSGNRGGGIYYAELR